MDYLYDERKELGRGGMAVVYTARKPGASELVALKRPLPFEDAPARLEREIEALLTTNHPRIMRVLDHGVDDKGEPWYAMPLATGSLGDLWRGGQLGTDAESVCAEVLEAACEGLAAMHTAGYVHRDVTPRNILGYVDPDQPTGYWWVVADCGLARAPLGETGTDLTRSASRLGTPGYMAPESFGEPHLVTDAADVYSLGRVLAHILTGEKPDIVKALLPEVGPWRPVIRAFTQIEAARRPQSMAEALAEAQRLLAPLPISEKAGFRDQIGERSGALAPDNPLWMVVADHLDDFEFMVDELMLIDASAAQRLATLRPESAATIAERLAEHLTSGEYGIGRDFSKTNQHLAWIRAVLVGLIAGERFDLLSDVAPAYCKAVKEWDRFPHNDALRPWLVKLQGQAATVMATAIQHAIAIDYFREMIGDSRPAGTALASLLEP